MKKPIIEDEILYSIVITIRKNKSQLGIEYGTKKKITLADIVGILEVQKIFICNNNLNIK